MESDEWFHLGQFLPKPLRRLIVVLESEGIPFQVEPTEGILGGLWTPAVYRSRVMVLIEEHTGSPIRESPPEEWSIPTDQEPPEAGEVLDFPVLVLNDIHPVSEVTLEVIEHHLEYLAKRQKGFCHLLLEEEVWMMAQCSLHGGFSILVKLGERGGFASHRDDVTLVESLALLGCFLLGGDEWRDALTWEPMSLHS
ncbi:MAG: hypothetical protein KDK99_04725 [Verrucomicrobiales bacterium]|nr:hypothetical protein [Verrucomicrobiales bacterium]